MEKKYKKPSDWILDNYHIVDITIYIDKKTGKQFNTDFIRNKWRKIRTINDL